MLVIDEWLVLSGLEQLANASFKRDCPIVRFRRVAPPSVGMQVVYDIAATENKDAFFS